MSHQHFYLFSKAYTVSVAPWEYVSSFFKLIFETCLTLYITMYYNNVYLQDSLTLVLSHEDKQLKQHLMTSALPHRQSVLHQPVWSRKNTPKLNRQILPSSAHMYLLLAKRCKFTVSKRISKRTKQWNSLGRSLWSNIKALSHLALNVIYKDTSKDWLVLT